MELHHSYTSIGQLAANDDSRRSITSSTAVPTFHDDRCDFKQLVVSSEENGNVTKVPVDQETDPVDQAEVLTQSRPRNESLSDWWILACTFLFNVLSGFGFSAYAVLYVPLTELFDTSRGAVGWIQSLEFSLGSLLGESIGAFMLFAMIQLRRTSFVLCINTAQLELCDYAKKLIIHR